MSDENAPNAEDEPKSPSSLLGSFLKDNVLKAKLTLQHELGLGKRPSVVPPGEVKISGEPRTVELGWHPVAGSAGKWFAEQTRLGKMITEEIHNSPDPTQHWAVIVDSFVHELWMDEHFDVIYINEAFNRDEWHTFKVGKTRFNDQALREAGEMVIFNMREKRPAYNLLDNNCQNFALNLLDKIRIGKHRDFATSFSVYQRAIGAGAVQDLFVDDHPDDNPETADEDAKPGVEHHDTLQTAQQVMDENTTKLDNHHSFFQ
ncbi:hypothetical protein J7T55_008111 [Diaporthe amygdali]|uniref:uncharacterized protein n=1 Tax=Phomopsis amygdali TaxID=1214568 RepID=UPI0022FDE391|nr:uncharacterized protein J7T55_008111 [Diaporthe amygdali]KAJ0107975.1 hypothetical protein J7T55_008111 [Diaporthe amygdali]